MTHTDNHYYNHHALRLHQEWLRKKTQAEMQPFLDLLEQGDRVLDLGCGNGMDLLWFAKAGFQGVGYELSSELVTIARSLHQKSGVEILHKNFLFLDFEPESVDAIWANGSFSELSPESLQRLLAICFKGLRSGGSLGAILHEGEGSFEEGAALNSDSLFPTRRIHLYSAQVICSMLEQAGFQIKKIGRKQGVSGQLNSMLVLAKRI